MDRKKISTFFVLFYAVWAVKEWSFSYFPDAVLVSLSAKYLIWILPACLYIKFVDRQNNLWAVLGLKNHIRKGILWGITISILLAAVEWVMIAVFHSEIHFNLGWRWLTALLFAFPEEVLFRGFLLQKISASCRFTKANFYTSLLFGSIHFPVWLIRGTTVPKWIGGFVLVSAVSFGLGFVFKRSRSIWSTTLIHTVYNLLNYMRG